MLGWKPSSSLLVGAIPGGRMRAVAPTAQTTKMPRDRRIMMKCGRSISEFDVVVNVVQREEV